MRLPHTDSAEAIWAFKKGYRFAEQGKPLSDMPVTVRAQPWLRDYFMQGYEQAQAELVPPRGDGMSPKKRAIWLLFAALAGLGTAELMIQQAQQDSPQRTPVATHNIPETASTAPLQRNRAPSFEKVELKKTGTPLSSPPPSRTAAAQKPTPPPHLSPKQAATQKKRAEPETIGLLDAEARAKLARKGPPPGKKRRAYVSRAVFARRIVAREPVGIVGNFIPKNIRKIYFFTEIRNGKGRRIHHKVAD